MCFNAAQCEAGLEVPLEPPQSIIPRPLHEAPGTIDVTVVMIRVPLLRIMAVVVVGLEADHHQAVEANVPVG